MGAYRSIRPGIESSGHKKSGKLAKTRFPPEAPKPVPGTLFMDTPSISPA